MAKARYFKADGKKGRARALPTELFDEDVNKTVLHRVVKAYLANQRQGTGSAKTRSEIAGGGRKPWKQKGTGRARQGSTRAPQWVGGGRAFPPIPHLWKQQIPKKERLLARRSALSARASEDRVVLIDPLDFDKPSTQRLVKYLNGISEGAKVLLLTESVKTNVVLSARNVAEIRVMPFGQESTYDILWAGMVVIERTALDDGAESAGEDEEAADA